MKIDLGFLSKITNKNGINSLNKLQAQPQQQVSLFKDGFATTNTQGGFEREEIVPPFLAQKFVGIPEKAVIPDGTNLVIADKDFIDDGCNVKEKALMEA